MPGRKIESELDTRKKEVGFSHLPAKKESHHNLLETAMN